MRGKTKQITLLYPFGIGARVPFFLLRSVVAGALRVMSRKDGDISHISISTSVDGGLIQAWCLSGVG